MGSNFLLLNKFKNFVKEVNILSMLLSSISSILIFLSTFARLQISSAMIPLKLTFTASVLTRSVLLSLINFVKSRFVRLNGFVWDGGGM